MDWQRSGLIGGILVVLYLLLLEWNAFDEKLKAEKAEAAALSNQLVTSEELEKQVSQLEQGIPTQVADSASDIPVSEQPTISVQPTAVSQTISVKTDVLDVVIDARGGDLIKTSLPKHLVELKENGEPFTLLNLTANTTYIAQSGLIGANATDTNDGRPLFSAASNNYVLQQGQDQLDVDLFYQQGDVSITKRFTFRRGDNLIDIVYLIQNNSAEVWKAGFFGQIKRDRHNPGSTSAMGVQPFLGAALRTEEENYKKLDFGDIEDESFKTTIVGGWVAMVQHYFVSAWIPDQTSRNTFNLLKLGSQDLFLFRFTSPQVAVQPGETGQLKAQFYSGPKDQYRLEQISPSLDLTVDYGFLWWIAKPLFWVMLQIHEVVDNWGWSIIILTLLIKLLFFKLSATSYRSMARMRKLQPEMTRLRELYGSDRQKLSQETMNLYKKEKVNPMGGCLPILVQMPVFLALYWVLLESVELRHTPWIFWIQDLSVKDPLFILPLIMGLSMFIQQKLNPAPPDPMQAKVMQIMPIAFTVFFMFFPAGLVLYWTVNNCLSILQQWIITRRIEAAD